MTRLTDAELGNHGEDYAASLLKSRGYSVDFLPTNTPTYDLKVCSASGTFLVSVKVSRSKRHVRLGQRKSILGLEAGNFVFAFAPPADATTEIERLDVSPYDLLILPGEKVKTDSVAIHDAYWLERSRDPNSFSIIVKAYDRYGRPTWDSWQQFKSAWHLLPPPLGRVSQETLFK
jgi:hypothetical protein